MLICQECQSEQAENAKFCNQCGVKLTGLRPEFEIKNGTLMKYQGKSEQVIIPDTVSRIGAYAFSGNEVLKDVTVPNGVNHIMEGAFAGCINLQNVTLPDTLAIIDTCAFSRCESLEKIELPNSLTHINGMAFWKCKCLKEIKIPVNVSRIEREAFRECASLEYVYFNAGLVRKTHDESDIFKDSGGEKGIKVVIGKDVRELPSYIFAKSLPMFPNGDEAPSNIVSVEFEKRSKCKVIREGAFKNCKKLMSIDLPEGLREIHAFAFYHCERIKIAFPESIKSIKESAFCDCTLIDAPKNLPITDWS